MENLRFLIPSSLNLSDIIQMVIIFFLLYSIAKALKNTRAWILVKGLLVIGIFYLFCNLTNMVVLKFLIETFVGVLSIALVIMFQPELQKFVEKLGTNNLKSLIQSFKKESDKAQYFSDQTIEEICIACEEMAKVKTGALIVLERSIPLDTETGINIDAEVTNQLLINIFEKNTPLHDGAVMVKKNRVSAATCYLPLSSNKKIKKSLGTRHRAGIGISETTDAIVVIVSEETGHISVCDKGRIKEDLSKSALQNLLKEESLIPNMKETIGNRKHETSFAFKTLILVVSVFLCVSIINIEDPVETVTFTDVPVQTLNNEILKEADKTYEIVQGKEVTVEVKGHRSDISSLSEKDVIAFADFEEMSLVQAIPIKIEINSGANLSAKIISDNIMKLELEDLVQREVPITVEQKGRLSSGYYLNSIKTNPETVLITGSKTSVGKIDKVIALADISGLQESSEQISGLNIYDKNGEIMDDLEMNTEQVNLDIEVFKTKTVPLKVELISKEYDFEDIETEEITFAADDNLLTKINEIKITLDGDQYDLSKKELIIDLNLYLPEGVYLPETQSNTATIRFNAIER